MIKERRQMSDAFRTALFIILSGGYQDAYTYCCRGKVFANAQTGNIVLMSVNLFDGDLQKAVRYVIPLLAFLAGIIAAESVHHRFKNIEKIHWRQIVILCEIIMLFAVGFMPQGARLRQHDVHRQHEKRRRGSLRLFPQRRQEDPCKGGRVFRRYPALCRRRGDRRSGDRSYRREGNMGQLCPADGQLLYNV